MLGTLDENEQLLTPTRKNVELGGFYSEIQSKSKLIWDHSYFYTLTNDRLFILVILSHQNPMESDHERSH